MSALFEIVEAKPWHCGQMIRALRPEQQQAIAALGLRGHQELRKAFNDSTYRRACVGSRGLAGLWGVTGTALSTDAEMWLAVAKWAAKDYPVTLIEVAKQQLRNIMSTRRILMTTILPGDKTSLRFAAYMGFVPLSGGERATSRSGRRDMIDRLEYNDESRVDMGSGRGFILKYQSWENAAWLS